MEGESAGAQSGAADFGGECPEQQLRDLVERLLSDIGTAVKEGVGHCVLNLILHGGDLDMTFRSPGYTVERAPQDALEIKLNRRQS